jgi:hypothetical protein
MTGSTDGEFDYVRAMSSILLDIHQKITYSTERVRARMRSSFAACSLSWNLIIFSFALMAVTAVHLRLILLEAAKPGARKSAI